MSSNIFKKYLEEVLHPADDLVAGGGSEGVEDGGEAPGREGCHRLRVGDGRGEGEGAVLGQPRPVIVRVGRRVLRIEQY